MSQSRKNRKRRQASRKLGLQVLENRRVLAASFDAGFAGSGSLSLDEPLEVEVDSAGLIYSADKDVSDNNLVHRFTPDGVLDPSFGVGGTVTIPMPGAISDIEFDSAGNAIVLMSDTASKQLAVAKIDSSGNLDTSFSGNGVAHISLDAGADEIGILIGTSLGLQANGDITISVAASVFAPLGAPTAAAAGDFVLDPGLTQSANREGFIMQLDSTGALDTTFGTAGVVLTESVISDLEIDASDRIVVSAMDWNETGPTVSFMNTGATEIHRYDANGVADPTFGTGGIAVVPGVISGQTLFAINAAHVAIADDGSIYGTASQGFDISNSLSPSGPGDAVIFKLDSTGALDPSFNGDGIAVAVSGVDSPFNNLEVTPLSNGTLIAGVNVGSGFGVDMTIVQMDPNGDLVPTFGNGAGGPGTFDLSTGSNDHEPADYVISGNRLYSAGFGNDSILAVNLGPTIEDASFSVAEDASNGTVVGSVTTVAGTAGNSYAITSGNGSGFFGIDPATGEITLINNNTGFDFESNPVQTLTVTATDAAGIEDSASVTINLTDVNEAPFVGAAFFAIDEGLANGSVVGSIVASDDDVGDTLTFAIIGGNTGSAFAVDASTGEITVNDESVLDFDVNPTFSLEVEVTDAAGLSNTETVTVNLNDLTPATNVTLVGGELTITGTSGSDNIVVSTDGPSITITGVPGGPVTFPTTNVDNIVITGGDGDDTIRVWNSIAVDAIIDGGDGNDNIRGGGGDDTIRGGAGDDVLRGRLGDDIVLGGIGNDTLLGNSGRDIVIGGDDADLVFGGSGQDIISGNILSVADDQAILELIRNEWTSDRNLFARALNVYLGLGPELTDSGFNVFEDVFSDGDFDFVNGGRGFDLRI